MTVSLLKGLPPFLRERNTVDGVLRDLRTRLNSRDENFLSLVHKAVYGNPASPYLPLLGHAGCEFGDLQKSVRVNGLENTLHQLRREGVFVTFDEFKGRQPIQRGHGLTFPVDASDFDNPLLTSYFTASTSGTTGRGNQVTMSLDHVGWEAQHELLFYNALGMLEAPIIICFQAFPGALGPRVLLRHLKNGLTPQAWFNPLIDSDRSLPARLGSRIKARGFKTFARLHGHRIPDAVPLPLDSFSRLAKHVHRALEHHGRCMFRGLLSMCLKLCIEAERHGLDLEGAVLSGGGEPPTRTRMATMNNTGARYYSNYSTSETGNIGRACLCPHSENDVHFFLDSLALIQATRTVPGWDQTVDAFHFTSLLASAPKILLNVESDDCGVLKQRSCGCPLGETGLTWHISDIYSFRKLTGQGVTLVGNDAQQILEELLPSRFGGTLQDYQLQEGEDDKGSALIRLVISPRVGPADEQEVARVFLQGLADCSNTFAAAMWSRNQSLDIVRRDPLWTRRGKYMPIIPLAMSKALGLNPKHTDQPSQHVKE